MKHSGTKMSPRAGALLACVALAVASCGGPRYELKLKPLTLRSVEYPLPSGMHLIFQEDRSQPSVAVVTVVNVGSSSDPKGKEGMAHLVEHLLFRARHDGQLTLMDRLKDLGGVINAFTSGDHTTYVTIAPKDVLKSVLLLEAQRLAHPLHGVTDAALAVEREVVRNEMRWRVETKIDRKVFDEAHRMLYPAGHPYHQSPIGTHHTLNSISLADAEAFVRQNYTPLNVTIVVDGNFDRHQTEDLLRKTFPRALIMGQQKQVTTNAKKPATSRVAQTASLIPAPPIQREQTVSGPVTAPTVYLAWSLPGGYREDMWLMQATVMMMQLAIRGALMPTSMEDEDLVDTVQCNVLPGLLSSMAFCAIEVTPGTEPDRIAEQAMDGLYRMWDSSQLSWQQQFFSRSKAQLMTQLLHASASVRRAVEQATIAHYTGRSDYFSFSFGHLSHINATRARDLAFKYLNRERVVKIYATPAREESGTVAFDSNEPWPGAIFEQTAGENKRWAKIPLSMIEQTAVGPDPKQLKQLTLSNGLNVVLKQHGRSPLVKVTLYARGGLLTTRPAGLARFANLQHQAKNPLQVAGIWSTRTLEDGQLYALTTPSGNLLEALYLLRDRIQTTTNNWQKQTMERELKKLERREKAKGEDPLEKVYRTQWQRLLPGHPLAQKTHDIEALKRLNAEDFERWINESLSPKNTTLLVVGDLDLERAASMASKIWSDWRKGSPGRTVPALALPENPPSLDVALVDDPRATQTSLSVSCLLKPATGENDATRDVLTTLLQEDFWQAIREKTGASYGVSVRSAHYLGGTSILMIESNVQSNRALPALSTIIGRLSELAKGRINRAHLIKAKWSVARRTRIRNLSIDEMLHTLITSVRDGLAVAKLSQFPQRLVRVSPRHISEILGPCAGREVVAAVGPKSALVKQLKTLDRPVKVIYASQ